MPIELAVIFACVALLSGIGLGILYSDKTMFPVKKIECWKEHSRLLLERPNKERFWLDLPFGYERDTEEEKSDEL